MPYVPNECGRSVRRDTASFTGNKVALWRWRDAIHDDFAARMAWTVMAYDEANQPPVASGEYLTLERGGTTDPDGDALSYLWFQYPEPGSYPEPMELYAANLYQLSIRAPTVGQAEAKHFVLAVTDEGTPPMTRYTRVIVNIVP